MRWKFGDGDKAKGKSVRHAFIEAGTFKVRVTLKDAVGNKTTKTVRLTVKQSQQP